MEEGKKSVVKIFGRGDTAYCYFFDSEAVYIDALETTDHRPGLLVSLLANFNFKNAMQMNQRAKTIIVFEKGRSRVIKHRGSETTSELIKQIRESNPFVVGEEKWELSQ